MSCWYAAGAGRLAAGRRPPLRVALLLLAAAGCTNSTTVIAQAIVCNQDRECRADEECAEGVCTACAGICPNLACLGPDGVEIVHGDSKVFYSAPTVAHGLSCLSELRSCDDGYLSGTYADATCTAQAPASCTGPDASIPHGESRTYFATASVSYGGSCESEVRVCDNGVLSGSFTQASCTVAAAADCTGPDGVVILHAQSRTYYAAATVAAGSSCASELRTCSNGTLNGTYQHPGCTVASGSDCIGPDTSLIAHGSAKTYFATAGVAYGGSCVSESRTCTNGVLSGTYAYPACTAAPGRSCTGPDGSAIAHGQSSQYFATRFVLSPRTCAAETRTCVDGTLSGSYAQPVCCPAACQVADGVGNIYLGCYYTPGLTERSSPASTDTRFFCGEGGAFFRCAVPATVEEAAYWNRISSPVQTGQTIGTAYCNGSGWVDRAAAGVSTLYWGGRYVPGTDGAGTTRLHWTYVVEDSVIGQVQTAFGSSDLSPAGGADVCVILYHPAGLAWNNVGEHEAKCHLANTAAGNPQFTDNTVSWFAPAGTWVWCGSTLWAATHPEQAYFACSLYTAPYVGQDPVHRVLRAPPIDMYAPATATPGASTSIPVTTWRSTASFAIEVTGFSAFTSFLATTEVDACLWSTDADGALLQRECMPHRLLSQEATATPAVYTLSPTWKIPAGGTLSAGCTFYGDTDPGRVRNAGLADCVPPNPLKSADVPLSDCGLFINVNLVASQRTVRGTFGPEIYPEGIVDFCNTYAGYACADPATCVTDHTGP
ncbi:MAG: hypothetical protein HY903_19400 [Deltaproteobacteria bacterium]|nr:hypothetical protein [Deltaproteobacteria bacterium]